LTDGLSPIAISLSRQLLEHGDYVVAGIFPAEFNSARGDELREFMAEVAREGSGVQPSAEMELDDEETAGTDDRGSDDNDADEAAAKNDKRKAGKAKVRRKRWRERFRLVGIDGR
jgi:hypothetical protein